jgi:hypothetical protein
MHSRRQFTPGNNSNAKRIINYNAVYDQLRLAGGYDTTNTTCNKCMPMIYNKSTTQTDSPSIRLSNNRRISQIINITKGGNTEYGNFYLGQPLELNYLGNPPGLPSGSNRPPRNQFNNK